MKRTLFGIILILCAFVTVSNAQWVFSKQDAEFNIRRGMTCVYNTRFDSATIYFNRVISDYPDHPAGYFMDAMVEWWKIQIQGVSKSDPTAFLYKIDRVTTVCDKLIEKNENDIIGLFFKGGALGFRGRYYASSQSWLKAANDGREALDILVRCSKIAPGNSDIMLGTGIYNYYAASLPEKYPALKTVMVFLPSGDKKLGLLQLESASKNAKFANVEAKVLLQQVYGPQFDDNRTEYNRICTDLYTSYPGNAIFHRKYAYSLTLLGQNDTAQSEWRKVLNGYRTKQFGYDVQAAREALYYIGTINFTNGKIQEALPYLYKCDEACRALNQDDDAFMIKLNITIGKIYDLQGQRELALKQYNKILSWDDLKGSHDEVKQYIQKPYGK
ncbi:MAG: tetratricopeptide repeat protein [Candidatus Kapabacteria bacterium]|nr:tetratricopeptide repeat protein [Candidatus Kapabacteria bacterium]